MAEQSGEIPLSKKPALVIDTIPTSRTDTDGKVRKIFIPVDEKGAPIVPFDKRNDPVQIGEFLDRRSTEPTSEVDNIQYDNKANIVQFSTKKSAIKKIA